MAQLVRAPPCHGGGRRFESDLGRFAEGVFSFVGGIEKNHRHEVTRFFSNDSLRFTPRPVFLKNMS